MSISFNHQAHLIDVAGGQTTLDMQDLINAIRTEEESERGICYGKIADASGKESLGGSVAVGLTVALVSPWQVRFEAGNYIAKISGGNLVGGVAGDPVAYSAGVQVLLIQSAASTVVAVGGSALTTEEHNKLMGLPQEDDIRTDLENNGMLPANIRKINNVDVVGTGAEDDLWRA